jgi:glycosyltransferase involved in cell wall biosynthesis
MPIINTDLTLKDLPFPRSDKTGWPWTEQSEPLPEQMPDGFEWPRITIITPSYNQEQFIEETIRSVLLQGYPNLEYIIIDGGSTDKSIEIIKKYEPWIAYWVSEKDNGQSHAINKGFQQSTGEITNWLCSDDLLLPNALRTVVFKFLLSPDVGVVVGKAYQTYENATGETYKTNTVGPRDEIDIDLMPATHFIPQPSTFYQRKYLDRSPPVLESYSYAMDFELWNYFKAKGVSWKIAQEILSVMRNHESNKSTIREAEMASETQLVYREYTHEIIPLTIFYKNIRLPLIEMSHRSNSFWLKAVIKLLQITYVLILSPFYGLTKVRRMYLCL